MSANTNAQAWQTDTNHIVALLNGLPPESLPVVEQFIRFLQEQSRQGHSVAIVSERRGQFSFQYPTIRLASSSLNQWLDLVPEGYKGDALSDAEALDDAA